ncbi:hypothetical protein Tco_0164483 [Tanacetum coccineum]
MKVIKEGSKKLGLLKINDDSFASDTSLGTIYNEFNRLSGMDDDLFTYEVEIPGLASIPFDLNEEDELVRLMDVTVEQWLDLMYGDHKKTRCDDEVELTDEEFSDPNDKNLIDKDEVAKIFRIETNIFDFETPTCKAFNEFNYLFQINPDVLTKDTVGFKTYEEYKDDWIYEW